MYVQIIAQNVTDLYSAGYKKNTWRDAICAFIIDLGVAANNIHPWEEEKYQITDWGKSCHININTHVTSSSIFSLKGDGSDMNRTMYIFTWISPDELHSVGTESKIVLHARNWCMAGYLYFRPEQDSPICFAWHTNTLLLDPDQHGCSIDSTRCKSKYYANLGGKS